jgi:hypothetical protein
MDFELSITSEPESLCLRGRGPGLETETTIEFDFDRLTLFNSGWSEGLRRAFEVELGQHIVRAGVLPAMVPYFPTTLWIRPADEAASAIPWELARANFDSRSTAVDRILEPRRMALIRTTAANRKAWSLGSVKSWSPIDGEELRNSTIQLLDTSEAFHSIGMLPVIANLRSATPSDADIVIFLGHALPPVDETPGLFKMETNRTPQEFVDLFRRRDGSLPFVVVLGACATAKGTKKCHSIAAMLHAEGVGIVVGFDEIVRWDAVKVATQTFVGELLSTGRIGHASAQANAEMAAMKLGENSNLVVWSNFTERATDAPRPGSVINTAMAIPPNDWEDYPERTMMISAAPNRGVVVILGPSGVGKSTLAALLAFRADQGFAWTLDGADQNTVLTSLAKLFLDDLGSVNTVSSIDDIEFFAGMALDRLRSSDKPWVVVLDGANDHSDTYHRLPIPKASAGQVLIISTTHESWRNYSFSRNDLRTGVTTPVYQLALEPVRFTDRSLGPLTQICTVGLPLLRNIYKQLVKRVGSPRTIEHYVEKVLRSNDPHLMDAHQASDLAVKVTSAVAPELIDGFVVASALPSGGITQAVTLELSMTTSFDQLRTLGILNETSGVDRLHSLLRESCFRVLRDGFETLFEKGVLGSAQFFREHERLGSLKADHEIGTLLASLQNRIGPSSAVGIAMIRLGKALELHGDVPTSADFSARGLAQLEDKVNKILQSDARLSIARLTNQSTNSTTAAINEALGQCDLIIETMSDSVDNDAKLRCLRAMAMRGLLLRKLAVGGHCDTEALAEELLDQSTQLLERSVSERCVLFGVNGLKDPLARLELLRAKYNLTGNLIATAKLGRAEDFARARTLYEEILSERIEILGTTNHPHVAACYHGIAIVWFEQSLHDKSASISERRKLLSRASGSVQQAIDIREILSPLAPSNDLEKSLGLQAKITEARREATA